MKDLHLPVLIYVSKEKCPGCIAYNSEWEKVKTRLQGRARFVKFICNPERVPPPPIQPYVQFYPTVILAGPKSYFRCFTPEDDINWTDYVDGYIIRARKFNWVDGQPAGRPFTADNTVLWFNQIVKSVPQYDEVILPSRFKDGF